MSRAQQTQVLNTATANNTADQTAATTATAAETADIGNYESQLSKYAANNPYTAGGEFQTSQNQSLAGTADAGSAALTNALDTQAKRTGQNAGAANATAAETARANQRTLSTEEGNANTQRIGDEANYNAGVLQATAAPVSMEAGIANPNLSAADANLGIAADTAKTPDFWDTLGDSFAQQLGKTAAGGQVTANLKL
jgi:hypothetical protein